MSKRDEGRSRKPVALQAVGISRWLQSHNHSVVVCAVGFAKAVQKFVVVIIMACPLLALGDWVEQRLTLEWRNWLTSYLLRAYFADRSFFKLKQQAGNLDNPDQVLPGTGAVLSHMLVTISVQACPALVSQTECLTYAAVQYKALTEH